MSDLYRVLGLSARANQRQIKTAYRELAKRSHPDVNAGDKTAEQRIKDINRAYEVLSDVEARAAYDRELARGRAEVWRRRWHSAATAGSTFVATLFVVSVVALWRQQVAEAPAHMVPAIASQSTIAARTTPHDGKGAAPGADEPMTSVALAENKAPLDGPGADDALMSDAAIADLYEFEDKTRGAVEPNYPPADPVRASEPSALVQQAPSSPEMASTDWPEQIGADPSAMLEQPGLQGQRARSSVVAIAPAAAPPSVAAPASWTTYRNARFGFGVSYPANVFAVTQGEIDEHAHTVVS